jgi:hypothetical protein
MSVKRRVQHKPADPGHFLGEDLGWILQTNNSWEAKKYLPAVILEAAASVLNDISGMKHLHVRKAGPGVVTLASRVTSSGEKVALPFVTSGVIVAPTVTPVEDPAEQSSISYNRVALVGDEDLYVYEVRVGKQQGVICMLRGAPGVVPGVNRDVTCEVNLRELLERFSVPGWDKPFRDVFKKSMEKIGEYEGVAVRLEEVRNAAKRAAEEAERKAQAAAIAAREKDYGNLGWGQW